MSAAFFTTGEWIAFLSGALWTGLMVWSARRRARQTQERAQQIFAADREWPERAPFSWN